jgi:hypothetical protein
MKKVIIRENLKGKILNDLLLFTGKRSNKMSLVKYHHGNLTIEEFGQMQMEYHKLILTEDIKRRQDYFGNIDGYREWVKNISLAKTKEEAIKYLDVILEEEMGVYSIKYEDYAHLEYVRYNGKASDFLYAKFTRYTPVTVGPVFEMCYFSLGETYEKILSGIHELFEYPIIIDNEQFEDLAFYSDDRVVLALCSHERFSLLNLFDEEYKEFSELDILHEEIK